MSVEVPGLPALTWTHAEGSAQITSTGIVLVAAPGVDWTNDAASRDSDRQHGATSLSFPIGTEDFQLSAKVRVDAPRSTFDAAVLTLWSDENHWAKLCFELSPDQVPMVVSVVTNTYSDDVNSTDVEGSSIWLRVSKVGPAFVFHSSTDGASWRFVRLFRLLTDGPVAVGFMAQAPLGDRAVAHFEDLRLVFSSLTDLRDGQ